MTVFGAWQLLSVGCVNVVCSVCLFVDIRCNLLFVACARSALALLAAAVLCALSSFATRESWGLVYAFGSRVRGWICLGEHAHHHAHQLVCCWQCSCVYLFVSLGPASFLMVHGQCGSSGTMVRC
jgi:hypothetical protein